MSGSLAQAMPALADAQIRTCVLTGRGAFSVLRAEWDLLLARARGGTIFQTPTWVETWWDIYGVVRQLKLFTARDPGGELIGLAPLMVESARGRRRLTFVGNWASGQHDLVVAPGREREVGAAFARWVTTRGLGWDEVYFFELPADSTITRSLAEAGCRAGLAASLYQENRCPAIALAPTWEGYLASLGKKERHELKRKMKRLERELPAQFRTTSGGRRLNRDLRAFFAVNRKRWGRQGLWAPSLLPYLRRRLFLHRAARRFAARGALHLHLLEHGDETLAGVLSFDHGRTCYAYLTGFDPGYARVSPGIVTFAGAIEAAIGRGMESFSFVLGEHPYKYDLGATDAPLAEWRVTL